MISVIINLSLYGPALNKVCTTEQCVVPGPWALYCYRVRSRVLHGGLSIGQPPGSGLLHAVSNAPGLKASASRATTPLRGGP